MLEIISRNLISIGSSLALAATGGVCYAAGTMVPPAQEGISNTVNTITEHTNTTFSLQSMTAIIIAVAIAGFVVGRLIQMVLDSLKELKATIDAGHEERKEIMRRIEGIEKHINKCPTTKKQ